MVGLVSFCVLPLPAVRLQIGLHFSTQQPIHCRHLARTTAHNAGYGRGWLGRSAGLAHSSMLLFGDDLDVVVDSQDGKRVVAWKLEHVTDVSYDGLRRLALTSLRREPEIFEDGTMF